MAALDLTGGMDLAIDEVTDAVPASPAYREGVSLWCWDESGHLAFPRIGVEAVGATWEQSFDTAICLAQPGGRLLLVNSQDRPSPPLDDAGRARVLGAGGLRFTCVEPFGHWTIDFDGAVVVTDWRAFLAGRSARLRIGDGHEEERLSVHLEARMVAPPWCQGTYEPEGHFVLGEHRFEQLCAVEGEVTIGGIGRAFNGGGLRVHRKGGNRSDYGDFFGHCWQSAWFPSGRAFGYLHYHPRPDGSVKYREGWLLDDGELIAARVEGTRWMGEPQFAGEDVSFVLHTARGEVAIEAETVFSSFRPPRPMGNGATFPVLQSGIARYRWAGEQAHGMIERSAVLDTSR